jgi:hypothetical protein
LRSVKIEQELEKLLFTIEDWYIADIILTLNCLFLTLTFLLRLFCIVYIAFVLVTVIFTE